MKGEAPSLVPQELPVEESWPNAFACTQEVAELPKPETTRLVLEARPVLSIEKSVVVALAVEEPIANRIVLVEPLFAWTESFAHGEEDATPMVPVVASVNAVDVEVVAESVPKIRLPMESWLLPVLEAKSVLYPIPMLFEAYRLAALVLRFPPA